MSRDYTYCLECGSESNVAARKCEKCRLNAEIVNREGEKQEMREVIDRLKAEVERQIDDRHKLQKELNAMENEHFNETNKLKRVLERERAANAKLREAAKNMIHSLNNDTKEGAFYFCDELEKALLAAKQDEENG